MKNVHGASCPRCHAGSAMELLRPREPAAALVGCRALRDRTHAVHLRHPDFHAAEGVASFRCIVRGPSPGAIAPATSIRNLDDQEGRMRF